MQSHSNHYSLKNLKTWWDALEKEGPAFGYFPKASKSLLILKNPKNRKQAAAVFKGCEIQISDNGARHLGAAVGSEAYKKIFLDDIMGKFSANTRSHRKDPTACRVFSFYS